MQQHWALGNNIWTAGIDFRWCCATSVGLTGCTSPLFIAVTTTSAKWLGHQTVNKRGGVNNVGWTPAVRCCWLSFFLQVSFVPLASSNFRCPTATKMPFSQHMLLSRKSVHSRRSVNELTMLSHSLTGLLNHCFTQVLLIQATVFESIPQAKEHKLMCCDATNLLNEQWRKGPPSAMFNVSKLWVRQSVDVSVHKKKGVFCVSLCHVLCYLGVKMKWRGEREYGFTLIQGCA